MIQVLYIFKTNTMKQQKVQAILMATDKESNIWIDNLKQGKIEICNYKLLDKYNLLGNKITQHLHIISVQQPKEGDMCIDIQGIIFKHENHFPVSIGQRTIVSSTDESLGLPAPDNNSIQYIIDEFNSGKTEVYGVVEQKEYLRADNGQQTGRYFTTTNPDNTISIKPIEESWDDVWEDYFAGLHNISQQELNMVAYLQKHYSVPTKLK